MYKVNCLNPISGVGLNLLGDKYEKVENLAEADIALVRSAAMHDLKFPENLQAVARAGAGVNNIPLDKCAEQGIVVFNTPGANAHGVKELVIAGMLLASRDIIGGAKWVESIQNEEGVAKLVEKGKSQFAGKEIRNKKLGVIGLGAIGVLVANAAKRLGMEVYGYDPYISVENAWVLSCDIHHVKTVDEIYERCDYISVHVPLVEDTKQMINKDSIAKMQDKVIILNFARDLLVNDDDMEKALADGKVAKYVTDFPNQRTASMPGVIAIPHLGASTEESEDNCAVMAVKQLMDYVENGTIRNSVNYPKCELAPCKTVARVAINHKNVPNIITQLTNVFSSAGINISELVNKSRGDYAYSVLDLDSLAADAEIEQMKKIDGVLRVRVLK